MDNRILLVFCLAQVFYALTKKTLPSGMPYLMKDPRFMLSHKSIGEIYYSFAIAYGLSKYSPRCDKTSSLGLRSHCQRADVY